MTDQTTTTTDEVFQRAGERLAEMVSLSLTLMRQLDPKIEPLAAAQEVFRHVSDALELSVSRECLMAALMMTYEGLHPRPMSFIEIGKARKLMVSISAARSRVEGRPALIIPGGLADE